MSDAQATLIRCFEATFPELPGDDIPTASVDSIEEWDSLRSLTLIAVLEEQFQIEIPVEELPVLRSFESIRDYLRDEHRLL